MLWSPRGLDTACCSRSAAAGVSGGKGESCSTPSVALGVRAQQGSGSTPRGLGVREGLGEAGSRPGNRPWGQRSCQEPVPSYWRTTGGLSHQELKSGGQLRAAICSQRWRQASLSQPKGSAEQRAGRCFPSARRSLFSAALQEAGQPAWPSGLFTYPTCSWSSGLQASRTTPPTLIMGMLQTPRTAHGPCDLHAGLVDQIGTRGGPASRRTG